MREDDLAEVWARSLADLADMQIEPHQRAWLQLTRPLGLVENTALIAAPNEFVKEQLETRLRALITNALSRELAAASSSRSPSTRPPRRPRSRRPPRRAGPRAGPVRPGRDRRPGTRPDHAGRDRRDADPGSANGGHVTTDLAAAGERSSFSGGTGATPAAAQPTAGSADGDRTAEPRPAERAALGLAPRAGGQDPGRRPDRARGPAEPGRAGPGRHLNGADDDLDDRRRDRRDDRRRAGPAIGPAAAGRRPGGGSGLGQPPRPAAARLNPKYTFETFVIGSSNRFAHAAAVAVAEAPGQGLQPAVHLRRLRAGQDPPAARHRALRAEPLPGPQGPLRELGGVHQRLHQLDPGRQAGRLPPPLPGRRRAAGRRHPVPGEQGRNPGGVLPHLQHAAQREQADRDLQRPGAQAAGHPGGPAAQPVRVGPAHRRPAARARDPHRDPAQEGRRRTG